MSKIILIMILFISVNANELCSEYLNDYSRFLKKAKESKNVVVAENFSNIATKFKVIYNECITFYINNDKNTSYNGYRKINK